MSMYVERCQYMSKSPFENQEHPKCMAEYRSVRIKLGFETVFSFFSFMFFCLNTPFILSSVSKNLEADFVFLGKGCLKQCFPFPLFTYLLSISFDGLGFLPDMYIHQKPIEKKILFFSEKQIQSETD